MYFEEYPDNIAVSKDTFTIIVKDPCDTPYSIESSAPLVDQEYTITQAPIDYKVPVFVGDPL